VDCASCRAVDGQLDITKQNPFGRRKRDFTSELDPVDYLEVFVRHHGATAHLRTRLIVLPGASHYERVDVIWDRFSMVRNLNRRCSLRPETLEPPPAAGPHGPALLYRVRCDGRRHAFSQLVFVFLSFLSRFFVPSPIIVRPALALSGFVAWPWGVLVASPRPSWSSISNGRSRLLRGERDGVRL